MSITQKGPIPNPFQASELREPDSRGGILFRQMSSSISKLFSQYANACLDEQFAWNARSNSTYCPQHDYPYNIGPSPNRPSLGNRFEPQNLE
jgi:hypothetical protein